MLLNENLKIFVKIFVSLMIAIDNSLTMNFGIKEVKKSQPFQIDLISTLTEVEETFAVVLVSYILVRGTMAAATILCRVQRPTDWIIEKGFSDLNINIYVSFGQVHFPSNEMKTT